MEFAPRFMIAYPVKICGTRFNFIEIILVVFVVNFVVEKLNRRKRVDQPIVKCGVEYIECPPDRERLVMKLDVIKIQHRRIPGCGVRTPIACALPAR